MELKIFLLYTCRKQTYFVDLFVRVSNKVAINMYKNLGYIVYRTVLEYYAGPGDVDEDAYGNNALKSFAFFFFFKHQLIIHFRYEESDAEGRSEKVNDTA